MGSCRLLRMLLLLCTVCVCVCVCVCFYLCLQKTGALFSNESWRFILGSCMLISCCSVWMDFLSLFYKGWLVVMFWKISSLEYIHDTLQGKAQTQVQ